MTWPKAIGLDACIVGMSFLKNAARVDTVIDPFCGQGTVLAVANYMGLNAIGVEISSKRSRFILFHY